VLGLLLAILGSHAATALLAVRYLIPVGLTDALLGLLLAPLVRTLLQAQGIHSPRPVGRLIGATSAERAYVDAFG
jgi:hypothetical protein